jgi:hypothetical protein
MEGLLTDLNHPSKRAYILPVAETGVEPGKVRCSLFICRQIYRRRIDTDCGELKSWVSPSQTLATADVPPRCWRWMIQKALSTKRVLGFRESHSRNRGTVRYSPESKAEYLPRTCGLDCGRAPFSYSVDCFSELFVGGIALCPGRTQ